MKKVYLILGIVVGISISLGSVVSAAFAPISVPAGGTGWVNFTSNTLLTGNGTGRLATTTIGSGLTLSGGVLTATGGAGGSGTVSTSTVPTVGQLAYWTSNAFPSLLGSVATTSVTCSGNTTCTAFTAIGGSPITISSTGGGTGLSTTSPVAGSNLLVYSASGAGAAYGVATSTLTASSPLTGSFTQIGTGGALGLDTSGTWSGNAGTATALASNPTNCSAGNYPLGIDASGNVENCTAAAGGGAFAWTPTTNYGVLANSTSTPIWFTAGIMASTTNNYFAGITIDNALAGDASTQYGKAGYEWILGYDVTDNSFAIASSTALGTSNALTIDKNLKVTMSYASTTALSGTNLCIGADCRSSWPSGTSPLSTKGDIYAYSSADGRFPVGTNGYVMQASTTATFGLDWVATSTLGISGGSGSGTVGTGSLYEFPYYAAAGTTLTATSSINLLPSGFLSFGTTTASMTIDTQTASTTIGNLITGNIVFDTDAGVVSAMTLPIGSAANGTVESMSFQLGNYATSSLTIYGLSDGANIKYPSLLFGTTTPATNGGIATSTLHITAGNNATTTVYFGSQNTTSKTCFNARTNTGAAVSFYFVGTSQIIEANECR